MNVSVEQFLAGLRTSLRELPRLLERWHDLDEDLQHAYTHQLEWMLDHFEDIQARAGRDERVAVALELVAARQTLFAMRDEICATSGVIVELAPRLSLATRQGVVSAGRSSPPPRVEHEGSRSMSVAV